MRRPCRPPALAWLATALLSISAVGCTFYFGDDDDDCPQWEDDVVGFRDPQTNQCEWRWGGGGGCAGGGPVEPAVAPSWAVCPGACEQLDEQTCLVTDGCRATYWVEGCAPGDWCEPTLGPVFDECVGVAPGWSEWERCDRRDAQACSETDACIAVYTNGEDGGSAFSYCAPETEPQGCYSDQECAPGWQCNADELCLPPPGCEDGACPAVCYGYCEPVSACAAIDCAPGYHCEETCYPCDDADGDGECPPYCEAACVPDTIWDPGTCTGDVSCDEPPPACPEGTVPGILDGCWSWFCIPESACAPADPGECYLPVACRMATPECPPETTPGVRDGCYTGFCIPTWACEP